MEEVGAGVEGGIKLDDARCEHCSGEFAGEASKESGGVCHPTLTIVQKQIKVKTFKTFAR